MWRCFANQAASSHTQKCIKTNSQMLLNILGCLLIDVLGAAVTCVHVQLLGVATNLISGSVQQLPQKLCSLPFVRTSAGFVAPSTHWMRVSLRDRRCLIMLSSIPRRSSSDVLLAAELAARRASAKLLQSFCRTNLGDGSINTDWKHVRVHQHRDLQTIQACRQDQRFPSLLRRVNWRSSLSFEIE